PFPDGNGAQLALSIQAVEESFNGVVGQHLEVRRQIRVGNLVDGWVARACVCRGRRQRLLPSLARIAFQPSLFLQKFLCFADRYFAETMPEVVAVMALIVLSALGAVKEAGEDTLGNVLLVGDAQMLALEPGTREPSDPRRITGFQRARGSFIAFFDSTDQLGH